MKTAISKTAEAIQTSAIFLNGNWKFVSVAIGLIVLFIVPPQLFRISKKEPKK